ncbi:MAG: 5-carboxymethyl-2-hydroxymuconate Delta-isomerase [Steroidobacteraceae bacterium]
MAHIVIEHSENLRGRLDVPQLVQALHQAALGTGIFPIGGLRTRAYATASYCIADGHPDNAFVHVSVRVGHGRDRATQRAACERIFAAACDHLATLLERTPLAISVEMAELDPELSLKKNNIHEHVKRRGRGGAQAGVSTR